MGWLILAIFIFIFWWLAGFAGCAFWWMGEFGDLEDYVGASIMNGLILGIFSWPLGILIHKPWEWFHPWRYDYRKPFWIRNDD